MSRFPNPNKFNRYISIEQRSITKEGEMGSPVETWTERCKAYASIRTLGGQEAFVSGPKQTVAIATHMITFRWPGFVLKPTDRVVYEGRVFNVSRVNNVEEANRFIEVWATEHQGVG